MRNETDQRRKIGDNGGDASISRRLTGEPDAVDPPVWFGGRGKVKTLVPTPIDFLNPPWSVDDARKELEIRFGFE